MADDDRASVLETINPKNIDENGEVKIKKRSPRAPRSVGAATTDGEKKLIATANAAMKKNGTALSASEKTRIIHELADEDYKKFASILLNELLGANITSINSRISDLESAIANAPSKILSNEDKKVAQEALVHATEKVQETVHEEPVKPKRLVKKKVAPPPPPVESEYEEEEEIDV